MDHADRRRKCRTVRGPHVRAVIGVVAPTGPLPIRPFAVDVELRTGGLAAEVAHQLGGQRGPALVLGKPAEGAGLIALQEQQDHAVVVAGKAGVIGHPGRADVGDQLTVETVCAPERFVVDEERLHGRTVRQPLGELIADTGEWRVVHDSTGQRRRNGDDDTAAARHQPTPTVHGHTVGGVLDQLHRNVEHDVVGDQGRQPTRDLAGAADESGGLRAALGFGEEFGRHATGLNGEQQVQE